MIVMDETLNHLQWKVEMQQHIPIQISIMFMQ